MHRLATIHERDQWTNESWYGLSHNAPLTMWVRLEKESLDTAYAPNLKCLASPISQTVWVGPTFLKWGHVTQTTPPFGVIYLCWLIIAMHHLRTKFEVPSLSIPETGWVSQ